MKKIIIRTIKSVFEKNLVFMFGLFLFTLAQANAQDLSNLTSKNGRPKYAKNKCNVEACHTCFRIQHKGGYVATIEVYTRDPQGNETVIVNIPRAHLGQCFDINYLLKNRTPYPERIRVWAHTGLVWAPKKLIFDELFIKAYNGYSYTTYVISGSTLTPKWKIERYGRKPAHFSDF